MTTIGQTMFGPDFSKEAWVQPKDPVPNIIENVTTAGQQKPIIIVADLPEDDAIIEYLSKLEDEELQDAVLALDMGIYSSKTAKQIMDDYGYILVLVAS